MPSHPPTPVRMCKSRVTSSSQLRPPVVMCLPPRPPIRASAGPLQAARHSQSMRAALCRGGRCDSCWHNGASAVSPTAQAPSLAPATPRLGARRTSAAAGDAGRHGGAGPLRAAIRGTMDAEAPRHTAAAPPQPSLGSCGCRPPVLGGPAAGEAAGGQGAAPAPRRRHLRQPRPAAADATSSPGFVPIAVVRHGGPRFFAGPLAAFGCSAPSGAPGVGGWLDRGGRRALPARSLNPAGIDPQGSSARRAPPHHRGSSPYPPTSEIAQTTSRNVLDRHASTPAIGTRHTLPLLRQSRLTPRHP